MSVQKILKKVTWALQRYCIKFMHLKITAVASDVVEGERGTRGNTVPQKMSAQGER